MYIATVAATPDMVGKILVGMPIVGFKVFSSPAQAREGKFLAVSEVEVVEELPGGQPPEWARARRVRVVRIAVDLPGDAPPVRAFKAVLPRDDGTFAAGMKPSQVYAVGGRYGTGTCAPAQLCDNGFHACTDLVAVYTPWYGYKHGCIVLDVLLHGDIVSDSVKYAATMFDVVRVVSPEEIQAAIAGIHAVGGRAVLDQHGSRVRFAGVTTDRFVHGASRKHELLQQIVQLSEEGWDPSKPVGHATTILDLDLEVASIRKRKAAAASRDAAVDDLLAAAIGTLFRGVAKGL